MNKNNVEILTIVNRANRGRERKKTINMIFKMLNINKSIDKMATAICHCDEVVWVNYRPHFCCFIYAYSLNAMVGTRIALYCMRTHTHARTSCRLSISLQ